MIATTGHSQTLRSRTVYPGLQTLRQQRMTIRQLSCVVTAARWRDTSVKRRMDGQMWQLQRLLPLPRTRR